VRARNARSRTNGRFVVRAVCIRRNASGDGEIAAVATHFGRPSSVAQNTLQHCMCKHRWSDYATGAAEL
jgi:hypothetical protein